MKIRDIMTKDVAVCSTSTNLAEAAGLMWKYDCGILPVIENRHLCGVITDRDICIALGTRGCTAAEASVGDVATPIVATCQPDVDLSAALREMQRRKVRRLPVVNPEGRLEGLLSLNDVLQALHQAQEDPNQNEIVRTLQAIGEPAGQPARAMAAAA